MRVRTLYFAECPPFWQDKKIKINPLNLGSKKYMDTIQRKAYVAMALNIVAVILSFIVIRKTLEFFCRRNFDKKSGCWDKFKFIGETIILIMTPVIDSIFGKIIYIILSLPGVRRTGRAGRRKIGL